MNPTPAPTICPLNQVEDLRAFEQEVLFAYVKCDMLKKELAQYFGVSHSTLCSRLRGLQDKLNLANEHAIIKWYYTLYMPALYREQTRVYQRSGQPPRKRAPQKVAKRRITPEGQLSLFAGGRSHGST